MQIHILVSSIEFVKIRKRYTSNLAYMLSNDIYIYIYIYIYIIRCGFRYKFGYTFFYCREQIMHKTIYANFNSYI
jgi:hypothetical protein